MSTANRAPAVRVDVASVVIAEGEYRGLILKLERGRAPWSPRKLAKWEQEQHRERRQDWHAYYHVRLHQGLTPATHESLRLWTQEHGSLPILTHACRYSCHQGSATPLPIRSQASNLLRLLRLVRPGTSMVGADIPFDEPLGFGVLARVVTRTQDWEGDRLPQALQRSVIRKILDAFPALSEWAVSSAQQAAGSEQQHWAPVDASNRGLGFSEVSDGSRSPHVGPGECASRGATPVAGLEPQKAGPTTGGDGSGVSTFVPPVPLSDQARRQVLRAMFGNHPEVSRRGPCPHCGDSTFARPGEAGRCPRCDGVRQAPRSRR